MVFGCSPGCFTSILYIFSVKRKRSNRLLREKKQMRLIVLACFIVIVQFQPVFAKNDIQLKGNIIKLKITQDHNNAKLSYTVKLILTNKNKTPILLLKPHMQFACINREIYGTFPGEVGEKRLFSLATLPSFSGDRRWKITEENLRSKSPPPNLIERIEPGKTISFEVKDWFYISKEKDSFDVFQNRMWDEI